MRPLFNTVIGKSSQSIQNLAFLTLINSNFHSETPLGHSKMALELRK